MVASGFGMNNLTNYNISMDDLLIIGNGTDPTEFFINLNNTIYNGYLWFFLLCLLWIILFMKAQKNIDQPLINIMYTSTVISLISLVIRAIYITKDGIQYGLITDFQLWLFPVVTIVTVFIIWATKD